MKLVMKRWATTKSASALISVHRPFLHYFRFGVRSGARSPTMDSAWLIWASLFSLVGFAVFRYGRKQQRGVATVVGIALMVYPSFVSSTTLLVGVGALLIGGLVVGGRLEDQ